MSYPKIINYRKGSADLYIERKNVPLIFGHIYKFKYRPTTNVAFHDTTPSVVYLDMNSKYDTVFGVNLHFVPKSERYHIMAIIDLAQKRMGITEKDLVEEFWNADDFEDEVTLSFASKLVMEAQDYIAYVLSNEAGFDWASITKLGNPYVKLFAIGFRQYKLSGMSSIERCSYMRSNTIKTEGTQKMTFEVSKKVKAIKKEIYREDGIFRGGWTNADTNNVWKMASKGEPWWRYKP